MMDYKLELEFVDVETDERLLSAKPEGAVHVPREGEVFDLETDDGAEQRYRVDEIVNSGSCGDAPVVSGASRRLAHIVTVRLKWLGEAV